MREGGRSEKEKKKLIKNKTLACAVLCSIAASSAVLNYEEKTFQTALLKTEKKNFQVGTWQLQTQGKKKKK